MKFDYKKIGIVFCLIAMMVVMAVPMVFADDSVVETKTIQCPSGMGRLYIDGVELTGQYFVDNPSHKVTLTKISGSPVKKMQVHICDSPTIEIDNITLSLDYINNLISSGSITDLSKQIYVYNSANDYVMKVSVEVSRSLTDSERFDVTLSGVSGFAGSLFSVATSTVNWITSNPLALIVCVLSLIGCGIWLFKMLSKGA